MKTSEILWVALDVPSLDEAARIAELVSGRVAGFKVGLELFVGYGAEAVETIGRYGRIFLDLKLHDIPNTVARAVKQAARLAVDFLTIHAFGGKAMLEAAKDAAGDAEKAGLKPPKLLAVTVLTSLFTTDLLELGIEQGHRELVMRLAKLAKDCGMDGVVASAHECREIKDKLGSDIVVATPGIRPEGFEKGDQKRVVTPKKALEAGADLIIVGRPIVQADDPLKAIALIQTELESL